jgi:hypothetical protein
LLGESVAFQSLALLVYAGAVCPMRHQAGAFVQAMLTWEPVSGFEPLTCRLQVCGAVQVPKPLPRWPSPGWYLAIRVCPVRRLHFWLHDRLLSRCLLVSFAGVRQQGYLP